MKGGYLLLANIAKITIPSGTTYDLKDDNAIPKANIVTSMSSSSTDQQVVSGKLFYDTVGDVEEVLRILLEGEGDLP